MDEKIIVTIGREFGSGGHDVGRKLADRLGIPFYDQELIDRAAQQSGLHKEYVKDNEEMAPVFNSGAFFTGYDSFTDDPTDAVRNEEFQVIEDIVAEGSCVIVGRAADFIIQDEPHVSVFIFAPIEERARRIKSNPELYKKKMKNADLNETTLLKTIKSVDKNRRRFYEFYTDDKWGDRDGYDLLINTSRTGIDGAVSIIETYINESRGLDIVSDL